MEFNDTEVDYSLDSILTGEAFTGEAEEVMEKETSTDNMEFAAEMKALNDAEAALVTLHATSDSRDSSALKVLDYVAGENLSDSDIVVALKVAALAGVHVPVDNSGEGFGTWIASMSKSFSMTVKKYFSIIGKWSSKIGTYFAKTNKSRIKMAEKLKTATDSSVISIEQAWYKTAAKFYVSFNTFGMLRMAKTASNVDALIMFQKSATKLQEALSKAKNGKDKYAIISKEIDVSVYFESKLGDAIKGKKAEITAYPVDGVTYRVVYAIKAEEEEGQYEKVVSGNFVTKVDKFSFKLGMPSIKETGLDLDAIKAELELTSQDRRDKIQLLKEQYVDMLKEGLKKAGEASESKIALATKKYYEQNASAIFREMKMVQSRYSAAMKLGSKIKSSYTED